MLCECALEWHTTFGVVRSEISRANSVLKPRATRNRKSQWTPGMYENIQKLTGANRDRYRAKRRVNHYEPLSFSRPILPRVMPFGHMYGLTARHGRKPQSHVAPLQVHEVSLTGEVGRKQMWRNGLTAEHSELPTNTLARRVWG